jgi:hypothetical protein
MTDERFSELLEGPLYHPLPMFIVTRLSLALMSVTFFCGKEGADALEAWCDAPDLAARDAKGRLTTERFNFLLNGPLHGDGLRETIAKNAEALRYVVNTCGKKGDLALESCCEDREAQDRAADGGYPDEHDRTNPPTGFSEE